MSSQMKNPQYISTQRKTDIASYRQNVLMYKEKEILSL